MAKTEAPGSSKNQPGLRPSPQPNDSVPVAAETPDAEAVPPKRNPRKELDEAEKDLARIKNDPMTADHAIRAAEARVKSLRDELGR